jgi:hypothetical protein
VIRFPATPRWYLQKDHLGGTNMKRTALITAAAIAIGLTAASAVAQGGNSQFHGMWNCNMTYTELDQQGNRKSGFVRYWQIQVNANNTFQVQGYTPGVYGNDPFQSQGQWKVEQGYFAAEGPEFGPNVLPGMKFMMGGTIQNGELSQRYDMKDPSGTWVMNRSLSACQRA